MAFKLLRKYIVNVALVCYLSIINIMIMRTFRLFLTFLLSITVFYCFGQTWTQLNPFPTLATYSHTCVLNEDEALFAVTSGILRTNDGGSSFETVYTGEGFIDLEMFDEKTGFILEDYPYNIVKTSDGGKNWNIVGTVFINYAFPNDMSFADSLHGWIVGAKNSIFRTQDGGVTWQKIQDNGNYHYAFNNCCFVSKDTGMITGVFIDDYSSTFYKTFDGGETLLPVNIPDGGGIEKIFMRSSSDIWLLGYFTNGRLAHSTNGGDTWTIHNICDPFSNCQTLTFFGDKHLRVTTDVGITYSDDGGQTWTEKIVWTNYYYFTTGGWSSPYSCYLCGMDGMILKSQNLGEKWDKLYSCFIADLSAIDFLDENFGCAVGKKDINSPPNAIGIYTTHDGGFQWDFNYCDSLPNCFLYDVQYIEMNKIIACTANDRVLTSNDGGSTWKVNRVSGNNSNSLYSINADPSGLIFTGGSKLYKSTDAGMTWQVNFERLYYNIADIIKTDNLNYVIRLEFVNNTISKLYKTSDGGNHWDEIHFFDRDKEICAFDFYNPQFGLISLVNLGVWITKDGGISWIRSDNSTQLLLHQDFKRRSSCCNHL